MDLSTKIAGLRLLFKKITISHAFSLVKLKDMALIALKISSFLLPLSPFPFPSSSKCYGETVALASAPRSLLLARPGFGSPLEGGECCYISWALFSPLTVAVLSVGGLERLHFQ